MKTIKKYLFVFTIPCLMLGSMIYFTFNPFYTITQIIKYEPSNEWGNNHYEVYTLLREFRPAPFSKIVASGLEVTDSAHLEQVKEKEIKKLTKVINIISKIETEETYLVK